jgi:hypothetical protein
MTTTFKAMGDMMSLLIDRSTLEELGIDEETTIVVTSDADGLHIRPIRFASPEDVEKATTEMMEIHAETLTRLAQ